VQNFKTCLSAELCEFNSVAGLNRRKEAPLSRIQFGLFAELKANLRTGVRRRWGRTFRFDTPDVISSAGAACGQGHHAVLTNQKPGKESCMKLNSAQVERALSQFEAQALPDDHPVVPQLASMFGDHTFFIDSGGLNVLEPTEASEPESPIGMIVNLAYWSDETLTKLSPHEPEPTGVIVNLESRH
jgi:hypothetical protein